MVDVGRVTEGNTVAISAAGGAVGSLAGQIAKLHGARVVGIAGGAAKCQGLLDIGFDEAVDYKAPDFAARLKEACPQGIDLYFDNTGGDVTLAVLPLLNRFARMPVCGFMAYYGMGLEGPGPDHMPALFRAINAKALEIRGFASMGCGPEALEAIARWMREGKLTFPQAVVEGLDAAPAAFASVFSGNSFVGKLLVKVAEAD
jgi:NADPH-dependent curcumin reductase CurA